MLISRVDEMSSEGRPEASDAHEYQTASELFDLMAKNHPYEDVSESLSTRDLVILYQNIDLGTKLMSDAEEYKLTRKPNQHVENVVYNDDPDSEGSDVSGNYSNQDLHNVFAINKERIDMLNTPPSYENTLCQKLGDLEIQSSNLSLQYGQHFLFKDPYIKEQLKSLSQVDGEFDGTTLPASLLDYICCKRLEDNYNFYMDNIIRYVKHTIEQLKRISNGDYLTDRAKEKWKEVEEVTADDDNTKVLATSTSIPLQVERKVNGLSTTWDDIIHSEVDIRSLSKILEKKIIVEVPKLICGSYKLFSKFCSDNLVISCKREPSEQAVSDKQEPRVESRVDVVLQLGRSESGQVMSNISSIMIVQPTPPIIPVECPKVLPLQYIQDEEVQMEKKMVKIVEIPEIKEEIIEDVDEKDDALDEGVDRPDDSRDFEEMEDDVSFFDDCKNDMNFESGDSSVALKDVLDMRAIPDVLRKEAPYNFISPDDLSLSMHRLNMGSVPEEASEDNVSVNLVVKKKSQTKVRIKSPYENKSYMIEEKKRKRLLEIREKREKKKQAIGENCKITKHRYGKGAIMPQPSSSVTRLSITNKSFYNSIYGQNMKIESQLPKGQRVRKGKKEFTIDTTLDQLGENLESPMLTPEKNSKKYINRSYYLDEAVTEMMYTDMKHSECSSGRDMFSGSASAVSAEFSANLNMISQIINVPGTYKNKNDDSSNDNNDNLNASCFEELDEQNDDSSKNSDENRRIKMISSRSSLTVPAPANSPNHYDEDNGGSEKALPLDCRKSIDKLYELMHKVRKIEPLAGKNSRMKVFSINDSRTFPESSTAQGSDSGTSIKHHLTSSNPSSFSFEKFQNIGEQSTQKTSSKDNNTPTTVVPKVIISSKQPQMKTDIDKTRKDRRKVVLNPPPKIPDNPLKAISQLLHEFDSVQKTRHKPPTDLKAIKRPESLIESRNTYRPGTLRRRSRVDQPIKEGNREIKFKDMRESETGDAKNVKVFFTKERRREPRLNAAVEPQKIPHQLIPVDDRHSAKKKIADIIDEVKEAKGEAVRGPSKPTSRLNTLAQPKKSYVQAHSEEYQTKYGRNLMADRLQRLAGAPPAARPKPRARAEAVSSVSVRPPSLQPLGGRQRRSASSSPAGKADASYKQSHATDPPDTMKDKMVAVESYVKSHYGHTSPLMLSKELLKARVPLVPHDLDIGSIPSSPTGEEATAIGSKLHHIISMMSPKPPPLSALVEAHDETTSKVSDKDEPEDLSLLLPAAYPHEPASSVDSEYRADIFEDKNVKTAVEGFGDAPQKQATEELDSNKSIVKLDDDSYNSSLELQKLEEAFNDRAPAGTFQKRLRIKNFTLTPKHSMRQVMVLDSGDAHSIVLKSTASRSLKMSCSHSDNDIRSLTNLGNAHLGWKYTNIPVQMATVGYAFPNYDRASHGSPSSPIKSLDNIISLRISMSSLSNNDKIESHNSSQRFTDGPKSLQLESQAATVDTETNIEEALFSTLPHIRKQLTTTSVATDVYVNHVVEEICRDCTNISETSKSHKEFELNIKVKRESVDCTSSLDVLVGLLNEIQKITTCHISNTEIYADEKECNELATLLTKGSALDAVKMSGSHELVSIASLDKLRQLESSQSIFSMYLSNDDKDSVQMPRLNASAKSVLCNHKPDCVDKEISADFPEREFTNTFTEVPSKFLPITITHSTNVSNSLVDILSRPSSQNMVALQEYNMRDSAFSCVKKIIEITEETSPREIFEKPVIERSKTELKKPAPKFRKSVVEKKIPKVQKVVAEMNIFSDETKCFVKSGDFDPMIKMKRDILVTMYSVLVLTVFAALSFPEILYHD